VFRATRFLAALAILAVGFPVAAQPRRGPTSRLAVDMVRLKSGKTIRGAVLHFAADGTLTLAVPREWLQKAYPDVFAKLTHDEDSVRRASLEQLRDRIKKALDAETADSRLAVFLRLEKKRVDKLLAEPLAEASQFVWFDVTNKQVAKVARATPDRQRIGAWGWYEGLANVETRDADDLARELKQRRIDLTQPPPDLSDRFAPRLQDDREWSARMALVAYALGKPLDFQGTGEMLVATDAAAGAADMAPLVAKLLGGQADALLKDLLGSQSPPGASPSPDAWLKPAQLEAERRKAKAFRTTRVDLSLNSKQAGVQSVFVVRLGSGNWETIWSDRETQDGTQQRSSLETTIVNDPQVKSALSAIKSLGVGGEDQFPQAIRFGAATMAAQQAVDSRFFTFRDAYVKRLDGPPFWWGK